jgi:hypothetical protein
VARTKILTRNVTLVDKNPACLNDATSYNRVLSQNLLDTKPLCLKARVVFIDPPWYEEYINAFLWHASKACEIGGFVFVVRPGEGTRAGMLQEWTRVVLYASNLGLNFVGLEPFEVRYETPYFERNALREAGVPDVPLNWRKARLARFLKIRNHRIPPPVFGSEETWTDNSLFGIRLRLQGDREFRNPSLKPILKGDILPSVSRSDPRRKIADVWTHGNRIFRCDGTDILLEILKAMVEGKSPHRRVRQRVGRPLLPSETRMVTRTRSQLHHLIEVEKKETEGFLSN